MTGAQRIKGQLVRILEYSVMAVMAALVIDVVWQVFTRYVIGRQSSWTEELATMLLMWGALLGAAVGFARNAHLGVDYLVNKLDSASRRVVALYVHCATALFGSVMIWGGWKVVSGTLATNQISPALGLKMGYVYLAVPISGLFILLFAAEAFREDWAREPQDF